MTRPGFEPIYAKGRAWGEKNTNMANNTITEEINTEEQKRNNDEEKRENILVMAMIRTWV
jgi:hypothetical protein